ncbi:MAG: protein kinase [Krumholzibacteria bacterium]|nr:protein kinase [Candidatus Krumholzibacteria bacterium]
MGVVYRALDLRLGRQVALKFLPPDLTRDPDARRRFMGEARTASSLDHPNICTIYDIEETPEGQIFIVMACYDGETLKQKLQRGPLGAAEAVRIARSVAAGLERAHEQGLVHRDVKPANVFVTNDGLVKVLDFGVAKLAGQPTHFGAGARVGTLHYMSPEQARGEEAGPHSDVWAAGVLLYEMITGRLPFPGHYAGAVVYAILNEDPPAPAALVDGVPSGVDLAITRALAREPARRCPSMREFADLLADTGEGAPVRVGERSIAVLPPLNLSPEAAQDYFCDGMADEIMNALARVPGLRVAARSSAFAFKGRHADARDIGRLLGVETLLEGSVRKSGDVLRITVQLIDAVRGHQIWSGRYDRELADVFRIQEEIACSVVRALQGKLGAPAGAGRLTRHATADVRAYDLYLKARDHFYQLTRRGLEIARDMFKRAAEADPGFALAWAGVADACSFLVMWYDKSPEVLAEASAMSARAVEMAPQLAEAHAARGLALSLGKDHEGAEREFARAEELDPDLFEAWYFHAREATNRGDLARAAELFRRANEKRPEDFQTLFLASQALRGLGRGDEARELALAGIATAERHLDLYPEDTRALYLGAAALVIYGDRERGLAWARLAAKLDPEDEGMLYQLACIHALAGEAELALDYLERWEREGALPREWLIHDSDLQGLRGHPRFVALLARLD